MKLENLYKNITDMTDQELLTFTVAYTNKRSADLAKSVPVNNPKKVKIPKSKTSGGKLTLTTEQLDILRKLKLV